MGDVFLGHRCQCILDDCEAARVAEERRESLAGLKRQLCAESKQPSSGARTHLECCAFPVYELQLSGHQKDPGFHIEEVAARETQRRQSRLRNCMRRRRVFPRGAETPQKPRVQFAGHVGAKQVGSSCQLKALLDCDSAVSFHHSSAEKQKRKSERRSTGAVRSAVYRPRTRSARAVFVISNSANATDRPEQKEVTMFFHFI